MIDKPKVLIADDESYVRELLKMISSSLHYEIVAEASNGEETLNLFREYTPDIMLLDINMPWKTGEEVLEELGDEIENTCVITLTSIIDEDSLKKCIKLGVKHSIRKDTPVYKMAKIINETWKSFETAKIENSNKYDLNLLYQSVGEDNVLSQYLKKGQKNA